MLSKFSTYLENNCLKVVGIVSDRAKALVKLGNKAYLNVCSMPDLFHFLQDIGSLGGLQIGKQCKKACIKKVALKKKGDELSEEERAIVNNSDEIIEVYQAYRKETRLINQTIHPFNNLNEWTGSASLNKNLLQSICKIGQLTQKLGITVNIAKATKILSQIPVPIAIGIIKGVETWVTNNQTKIADWVRDKVIMESERVLFERFLLPAVYFELQLERTKNGRTNHELVTYYEGRVEENQSKVLEFIEQQEISDARQEVLFEMAYQMAKSFQRSSSQVEGRNGYLAFIHHGQKRIPKDKKKALTVVHNFDTKRNDGSTPAQRLFRQEFPDLFEFLCQNMTGFKEPRKENLKC